MRVADFTAINHFAELTIVLAANGTALAVPLPTVTAPGSGEVVSQRVRHMLAAIQGGSIRWLATGNAPTAVTGIPVTAGGYLDWTDGQLDYWGMVQKLQMCASGGVDVTVEIALFN